MCVCVLDLKQNSEGVRARKGLNLGREGEGEEWYVGKGGEGERRVMAAECQYHFILGLGPLFIVCVRAIVCVGVSGLRT